MSPAELPLPDDGRIAPLGDSPSQRAVRIRPAGRVVLLDPDHRVLLMRYDDPPPNGVHWSTPGGGLNPGEGFKEGAARELAEETGWHDIELLDEIHRWTLTMEYNDAIVRQVERYYLANTSQPQREISGVEAMHESDGIATWRWWALDELDSTDEAIWPAELAELIRKTLA
jgi:ADP-ribose pyrophosphatase YjhB (NUDIX family)